MVKIEKEWSITMETTTIPLAAMPNNVHDLPFSAILSSRTTSEKRRKQPLAPGTAPPALLETRILEQGTTRRTDYDVVRPWEL